MALANILNVSSDGVDVYGFVRVPGDNVLGGQTVDVEYCASTPLLDAAGNQKSLGQIRSELTALLKAQRNALKPNVTPLAINGTLTL